MREFAEKIQCSRTYVSKLASGEVYASPRLARDILEATGGLIKVATKKEAEKKIKEESQDERIKKAAHLASTMMTHFESFDEHKQD
jgi:transcriptional regulator with XRE-family HTH domain